MKTFEDLEFKPHPISLTAKKMVEEYQDETYASRTNGTQAVIKFDNGLELSVIFGSYKELGFYSNGIDTYEAYCMNCDEDEPMGYLTTDEVTAYMIELQNR